MSILRSGRQYKSDDSTSESDDSLSVTIVDTEVSDSESIPPLPSYCSDLESNPDNKSNNSNIDLDINMSNFDVANFNKYMPTFKGEKSEMQKFFDSGDLLSAPLNALGKTDFQNHLVLKLEGEIYEWCKNREPDSWESLKALIKEKCGTMRPLTTLQRELMGMRQFPNETVRNYADRIEIKLREMNSAIIVKIENGIDTSIHYRAIHSQMALRTFQDELLQPLSTLIKARNFDNLSDAIRTALEEESITSRNDRYNNFSRQSFSGNSNGRNFPNFQNSGLICFGCNKKGHIRSECPEKNKQNNNYHR